MKETTYEKIAPSATLVATSLPIFALFKVEANSPNNSNFPVQITEFYNKRNLVSLFSSEAERELVIDSLVCTGVKEPPSQHILDPTEFQA